jgi:hypothetical protein
MPCTLRRGYDENRRATRCRRDGGAANGNGHGKRLRRYGDGNGNGNGGTATYAGVVAGREVARTHNRRDRDEGLTAG